MYEIAACDITINHSIFVEKEMKSQLPFTERNKSIRIIREYEDGGNRHQEFTRIRTCVRSRRRNLVDQPGRDHGQLVTRRNSVGGDYAARWIVKKEWTGILFLSISPRESFHTWRY